MLVPMAEWMGLETTAAVMGEAERGVGGLEMFRRGRSASARL